MSPAMQGRHTSATETHIRLPRTHYKTPSGHGGGRGRGRWGGWEGFSSQRMWMCKSDPERLSMRQSTTSSDCDPVNHLWYSQQRSPHERASEAEDGGRRDAEERWRWRDEQRQNCCNYENTLKCENVPTNLSDCGKSVHICSTKWLFKLGWHQAFSSLAPFG